MTKSTPRPAPADFTMQASATGPLRTAAADRDDLRPGPALAGLLGAIARTEELIDLETRSLEKDTPIDLQELGRRKTQALLELTRLARAVPDGAGDRSLADRLDAFRAKLERNAELLKLHLAAVREVATVIANALHDAEWDGTYDRLVKRSAPAR